MKRILALVLATLMITCLFAGCGSEEGVDGKVDVINSELWSAQESGKLTVGITLYKPMNYKTADGDLTGFETDFAKAVCKQLGVEPNFVEIVWDTKEINLTADDAIGNDNAAAKNATDIRIDCIWNGMAVTNERAAKVSFSNPYLKDSQVIVVKAADLGAFDAKIASPEVEKIYYAESGSVGSSTVKNDDFFKSTAAKGSLTDVETMYKALDEVKKAEVAEGANTLVMAVVSKSMALQYVGKDEFADLAIVEGKSFAECEIAVAFRQNSDLVPAVNEAIKKLMTPEEGKTESEFDRLVKKYGLGSMVIPKA